LSTWDYNSLGFGVAAVEALIVLISRWDEAEAEAEEAEKVEEIRDANTRSD